MTRAVVLARSGLVRFMTDSVVQTLILDAGSTVSNDKEHRSGIFFLFRGVRAPGCRLLLSPLLHMTHPQTETHTYARARGPLLPLPCPLMGHSTSLLCMIILPGRRHRTYSS